LLLQKHRHRVVDFGNHMPYKVSQESFPIEG
jgi:hypothetical protein